MQKHLRLLIIVAALALLLSACGGTPSTTTVANTTAAATTESLTEPTTESTDAAVTQELELTLEELAKYDGKDGRPAYVAVDGVIYDFSDSSRWKNGEHNGFEAGRDLTEFIKNESPHGVSVLERMEVVGKLID